MKTRLFVVMTVLMVLGLMSAPVVAQDCPPEVVKAQEMLKSVSTKMKASRPAKALAGSRGQDVQAPRGQDVQAPRGQDVQAPRGQDVQAPRGQDVQAPRGQDVQAPRGQDVQAPRAAQLRSTAFSNAGRLVKEAEAACRGKDNASAAANAKAAIELLNYLL
jgi:hypothetical protein